MSRKASERGQLDLFHALPGEFAVRDAQDLMSYPFFSLSKSHRTRPIEFAAGGVEIRVEAVADHGMATIWDADILIWAASQIVQARDSGLRTSRLMVATPYQILTFIGRGTSARDYHRLKAALDRLQSTTVCTSIRQPTEGRRHRFSWINEWMERTDADGRPDGIELIVPDWFYRAVLDDALILTIDRAYFDLTGGLDRWLYRLVRKHGGRQRAGWRFEIRHLHGKSGSLSPFKRFAFELRQIIRRQPCRVIAWRSKSRRGGVDCSPSSPVDKLWKGSCYREPQVSCHREPDPRAIGNPNRAHPLQILAEFVPVTLSLTKNLTLVARRSLGASPLAHAFSPSKPANAGTCLSGLSACRGGRRHETGPLPTAPV